MLMEITRNFIVFIVVLFNTQENTKVESLSSTIIISYMGHLSTEETMRLALRPCPFFTATISEEDEHNLQLAQLLLASADKVHMKQYDRARPMLSQCKSLSSKLGNSVHRVVHYFTCALQEQMDHETNNKSTTPPSNSIPDSRKQQEVITVHDQLDPALIAVFKDLPFSQTTGLAGIQAVVESVSSFKKVHLIDLQLGLGMRCIALMQALANLNDTGKIQLGLGMRCIALMQALANLNDTGKIQLLKLTVIDAYPRENVEETGKRLSSFAETLNLPFSFKVVSVSDIEEINKDSFHLGHGEEEEDQEAVVVYSQLYMREAAMKPNGIETLIRFISSLKPRIMVVKEVEANHHGNFQELLFYYSALFDALECCMARDDANRIRLESTYLRKEIKHNIEQRVVSHMKLDQWREVFSRYGMVEKELSSSSLYHAELVAKRFACGGCCTLERNGKSLTVGWKGTPLLSVSAWEFHQDQEKIAQSWNE